MLAWELGNAPGPLAPATVRFTDHRLAAKRHLEIRSALRRFRTEVGAGISHLKHRCGLAHDTPPSSPYARSTARFLVTRPSAPPGLPSHVRPEFHELAIT